jgi:two-component system, sensor histidine kinase ChiS
MDHDVALLARIIEHTPIGITILTTDRNIRYVNMLAEHLFNCGREALIGVPIDRFVVDREGEKPLRELWPSVMKGNIQEVRVGLSRQDSEELTCTLTAFCIGGKEGQQDSVAIIFRDITHELRIAEQLEKKNIEMAKMNTELIHSNIELMRLSELKSNFLSIASHELKTPLTSIMGYSDIIIDNMKERIDAGVYRMIESINRAADRLNKVINNILDVTKIEQKKLRLRPEMVVLTQVAQECIDELSEVAAKRGIVFNRFFGDNLPQFFGDRPRMHQVFTNLFTNAIKYSPDGSAVDVAIVVEDGARFHIEVKDRGIGIDQSEHKNIFDPFYEVGDIKKHSTDHIKFMGGGIGLGLSIVKGIVERHGGRIWVESDGVRPDEYLGSVFHIVLPVRSEIGWDDIENEPASPQGLLDDPASKARGVLDTIATDHRQKPTILIIDTDHEAVEISRMVLENAFDIITAPTGELGLSLAFQRRPFMVLLDAYLPGLDGFRICKLLRSQDETRDIPVVFLSSVTKREEIERCFASGADDFIVKPFGGRELVDKIWQLLMKKKADSVK